MNQNIDQILNTLFQEAGHERTDAPLRENGKAKTPVNWALVKYWGKRDTVLNLPAVSSLSIAVPLWTHTKIKISEQDTLELNNAPNEKAAKRIFAYLDLILGTARPRFDIQSENDVPTAAGFASSASGFAALILALNDLYGWDMGRKYLSILARIGSGSACRSLYDGFVKWKKGEREDGMDSYAVPLRLQWPELRIGMIETTKSPKKIGSTEAMIRCAETSPLYPEWLARNDTDMDIMERAIEEKDWPDFLACCESNALFMHETIRASEPISENKIDYFNQDTYKILQDVQRLRKNGLPVAATMDAGPQVKLLFPEHNQTQILDEFPNVKILKPLF